MLATEATTLLIEFELAVQKLVGFATTPLVSTDTMRLAVMKLVGFFKTPLVSTTTARTLVCALAENPEIKKSMPIRYFIVLIRY